MPDKMFLEDEYGSCTFGEMRKLQMHWIVLLNSQLSKIEQMMLKVLISSWKRNIAFAQDLRCFKSHFAHLLDMVCIGDIGNLAVFLPGSCPPEIALYIDL